MQRLWAVVKIVAWSLMWFIFEMLCILSFEKMALVRRARNKCYRKLVYIHILGQRSLCVREAQARYQRIENGISGAEEKYGLSLFGKKRS